MKIMKIISRLHAGEFKIRGEMSERYLDMIFDGDFYAAKPKTRKSSK